MGEFLYEGKAKVLYTTEDPDILVQYFKDDATAFNAKKRGVIVEKGIFNNRISEVFFQLLESKKVPTHYLQRQDERRMQVRRLKMFLLEVVARNVAAGSLAKRFGLEQGQALSSPVLEFYYKNDALDDPLMNEDHIRVLGLATHEQVEEMRRYALRANGILKDFLVQRGILLVDCKFEFGLDVQGQIRLGDEICPDTCRFWDVETGRVLDKDRFRRDMGGVEEAYREIWERVKKA